MVVILGVLGHWPGYYLLVIWLCFNRFELRELSLLCSNGCMIDVYVLSGILAVVSPPNHF